MARADLTMVISSLVAIAAAEPIPPSASASPGLSRTPTRSCPACGKPPSVLKKCF